MACMVYREISPAGDGERRTRENALTRGMVACVLGAQRLSRARLTSPTMGLSHGTRRGVISQFAVLLASGSMSSSARASDLALPALAEGRRRLYLVRHGETDWNVDDRIQGRTDNPLNDVGRSQADALARYLASAPIELVASSTLMRAATTADAVAAYHPSAPRVLDERFVEMGFGELEGQKLSDIQPRYKATTAAWAAGATGTAWPKGESCDDVGERGLAGLRDLGLLGNGPAAATCPRHVLIAAHGRFNKILIASLQGERAKCSEIVQGNTCINVIDLAPDGAYTVQVLNLRDHLTAAQTKPEKKLQPV